MPLRKPALLREIRAIGLVWRPFDESVARVNQQKWSNKLRVRDHSLIIDIETYSSGRRGLSSESQCTMSSHDRLKKSPFPQHPFLQRRDSCALPPLEERVNSADATTQGGLSNRVSHEGEYA